MTTTREKSRFLDLRALAALQHMRFTTPQRIEGAYSGRHASRQQGGAGEFVDFREYTGGEDLRRLDWKVLARTGKAFVRLHQDETNLLCTLALDASESMAFAGSYDRGQGSRGWRADSKLEHMQFMATAFSHLISQGQDQVGLAVLGQSLQTLLTPGGAPRHVASVQEEIERLSTAPSQSMAASLTSLYERSPRRGVMILWSDFLMDDLEDVFAGLRTFRHRGWEVITLHVVHPAEERLPDGVAYRFEDMEGQGALNCDVARIRADYERRFRSHTASVRQLALSAGCSYRFVSTASPYMETVQEFLVERAG